MEDDGAPSVQDAGTDVLSRWLCLKMAVFVVILLLAFSVTDEEEYYLFINAIIVLLTIHYVIGKQKHAPRNEFHFF